MLKIICSNIIIKLIREILSHVSFSFKPDKQYNQKHIKS